MLYTNFYSNFLFQTVLCFKIPRIFTIFSYLLCRLPILDLHSFHFLASTLFLAICLFCLYVSYCIAICLLFCLHVFGFLKYFFQFSQAFFRLLYLFPFLTKFFLLFKKKCFPLLFYFFSVFFIFSVFSVLIVFSVIFQSVCISISPCFKTVWKAFIVRSMLYNFCLHSFSP